MILIGCKLIVFTIVVKYDRLNKKLVIRRVRVDDILYESATIGQGVGLWSYIFETLSKSVQPQWR